MMTSSVDAVAMTQLGNSHGCKAPLGVMAPLALKLYGFRCTFFHDPLRYRERLGHRPRQYEIVPREHVCRQVRLFFDKLSGVFRALGDLKADHFLHGK